MVGIRERGERLLQVLLHVSMLRSREVNINAQYCRAEGRNRYSPSDWDPSMMNHKTAFGISRSSLRSKKPKAHLGNRTGLANGSK